VDFSGLKFESITAAGAAYQLFFTTRSWVVAALTKNVFRLFGVDLILPDDVNFSPKWDSPKWV
jgi:hypothetical protein